MKHLRRAAALAAAVLPALLRDAACIAGIAAITYGFWLIYQPLAWIVGGALGTWVAFLTGRPGS